MLKKISAALIAVSMLAAPAMAASTAKTETAPITKPVAPTAKLQVKPTVRTAHAKMGRHHHRHYSQHRSHKKVTASKINKTSKVSKVTIKPAGPATKRG
jgi:Ni/Co efflux regulator RcnB